MSISRSWSQFQQPSRRFVDIFGGRVHQPLMLSILMLVIRLTRSVADDLERRIKWPVARRVCRAKDGDDGNAEQISKMHGPGIPADEQSGSTKQRDELSNTTGDGFCQPFARRLDSPREIDVL